VGEAITACGSALETSFYGYSQANAGAPFVGQRALHPSPMRSYMAAPGSSSPRILIGPPEMDPRHEIRGLVVDQQLLQCSDSECPHAACAPVVRPGGARCPA
jgi:hypothetical protein